MKRHRGLKKICFGVYFKGEGIWKKSLSERWGGFISKHNSLAKYENPDSVSDMIIVSYELISSEP